MRPKHLVAILVLLMLTLPASPAHAGGVVTVCDEAHLLAALAGGGTVSFLCSGTITLTAEIVIAADTSIDGSGQTVTISGNHAVRVFRVNSGVTLNLNALVVADGSTVSGDGGGIYNAGTLIANNSIFSHNNADYGGGINNDYGGTLTVSNSTFENNTTVNDGAGIYNNSGAVTVSNSIFSGNNAYRGGGISNNSGGAVTVSNSTFENNTTANHGAGIYNNSGAVTVSNSTFSGNYASRGGGIFNDNSGTVTVSNNTFSSNSAGSSAGAIFSDSGMVTVSDSTFSGNNAGVDGGGIKNRGALTVSNSTFFGNSANGTGGGIYNLAGTLTVNNSTFFGNSATYLGGGIKVYGGTVSVSNSTFSGNGAETGGSVQNYIGAVTLKNTIVTNSPTGGNCSGTITDGGGNLSYPDATCPGINADPKLGPLQNNSGPTHTMALGPGSAAIDAANDITCAAAPVNNRDQRGIVRPQGTHCDIGAVEQYCPSFVPPGTVGVEDILAIATRWGWTNTTPGWDPVYDLNGDDKIDIVDITLVTRV